VIKLISFVLTIVLTQFFHFNYLKIKATRLFFFKLNQQYFFTVYVRTAQGNWKVIKVEQEE